MLQDYERKEAFNLNHYKQIFPSIRKAGYFLWFPVYDIDGFRFLFLNRPFNPAPDPLIGEYGITYPAPLREPEDSRIKELLKLRWFTYKGEKFAYSPPAFQGPKVVDKMTMLEYLVWLGKNKTYDEDETIN